MAMKNGKAEIICILDRSGSMTDLVADTIGGFNEFIDQQKDALDAKTQVTLIIFDDKYEVVYDRKPLKKVKKLDTATYFARGMTALNDAIGKTINDATARQKKDGKPDKTICLITTDGQENDSKEFKGIEGRAQVKKMVEKCQKKGWTFFFLGADINAFDVGVGYGFHTTNIATTKGDAVGTRAVYASMSHSVTASMDDDLEADPLQQTYDTFVEELEEEDESV